MSLIHLLFLLPFYLYTAHNHRLPTTQIPLLSPPLCLATLPLSPSRVLFFCLPLLSSCAQSQVFCLSPKRCKNSTATRGRGTHAGGPAPVFRMRRWAVRLGGGLFPRSRGIYLFLSFPVASRATFVLCLAIRSQRTTRHAMPCRALHRSFKQARVPLSPAGPSRPADGATAHDATTQVPPQCVRLFSFRPPPTTPRPPGARRLN